MHAAELRSLLHEAEQWRRGKVERKAEKLPLCPGAWSAFPGLCSSAQAWLSCPVTPWQVSVTLNTRASSILKFDFKGVLVKFWPFKTNWLIYLFPKKYSFGIYFKDPKISAFWENVKNVLYALDQVNVQIKAKLKLKYETLCTFTNLSPRN